MILPLWGFVLFAIRSQQLAPERATLFAFSAIILLLYLAGLIGWLAPARIMLAALGLALLLFELVRHRSQSLAALTSVPLVVLFALAVIHYALHTGGHFRFYDEYSHWGIHLKEMLAQGDYWGADSNSSHPRYPPGSTLWQYFILLPARYSEGGAYFAQFLLLVAPLMALLRNVSWRQPGWILVIVAVLLVLLAVFGHGFASLYVDHLIAAWVAGLVIAICTDERNKAPNLLLYAMPLGVLALLKDAGIFFSLSLSILFFVILAKRGAHHQRLPLTFAVWFLTPLLVTGAWHHNREISLSQQDQMSVAGAAGIITGETEGIDEASVQLLRERFVAMMASHGLGRDQQSYRYNESRYDTMHEFSGSTRVTTTKLLVFYVVAGALLIGFWLRRSQRPQWLIALTGMLMIAVAHLTILYFGYRFVFPHRDAIAVASFVRYANMALLPLLFLLITPLLPASRMPDSSPPNQRLRSVLGPGLPLLLAATLLFLERPWPTPLLQPAGLPSFRADTATQLQAIKSLVGENRLWVYFADGREHRLLPSILLYELSPTPAVVSSDPQFFARDAAAVLADLSHFDWVWIALPDQAAAGAIGRLTDEQDRSWLYAVKTDGEQTSLEPLGSR